MLDNYSRWLGSVFKGSTVLKFAFEMDFVSIQDPQLTISGLTIFIFYNLLAIKNAKCFTANLYLMIKIDDATTKYTIISSSSYRPRRKTLILLSIHRRLSCAAEPASWNTKTIHYLTIWEWYLSTFVVLLSKLHTCLCRIIACTHFANQTQKHTHRSTCFIVRQRLRRPSEECLNCKSFSFQLVFRCRWICLFAVVRCTTHTSIHRRTKYQKQSFRQLHAAMWLINVFWLKVINKSFQK